MKIYPVILGKGRAGEVIGRSLAILATSEPDWQIQPVQWLPRNELRLPPQIDGEPLLIIANPTGLHAQTLLSAQHMGYRNIFCEKPSCASLAEVQQLKEITADVAVFHVYRQMWGPQEIKKMILKGDLGQVIAIEGRYWQSSAAERALLAPEHRHLKDSWKNDSKLSGDYDTVLDIGSHWMDLSMFLAGDKPQSSNVWLSHQNAETGHRDSHAHITTTYPKGVRAFGSVSKTMHGATNNMEVVVVGSQKAATWKFLEADEIVLGFGKERKHIVRQTSHLGSKQNPFHALGWAEGYIEILRQGIQKMIFKQPASYPNLKENLDMLESFFKGEIARQR